jgi:serine/threonine protein kinase
VIAGASSNLPSQLGKWNIRKRLASREDKIVLLGERNGEFAAIKILKNADLLEDRERRRFDQEVINLRKIDHPSIPKIIDFDVVDAMQPWIATEFVSGPTLQEQVTKNGALKFDEWAKVLREIVSALAYVHSIGIYHRDISPSNIILHEDGAKLIDFGMSYLENTQTFSKSVMNVQGTPATLSPESLTFKKDPKMDMFSLGSTFVFAGTGKFPFDAEKQDMDWMYKVTNDAPNFQGISKPMESLLIPLFYKDPKERISSSEYLEILEGVDLANPNRGMSGPKLLQYLQDSQSKLTLRISSSSNALGNRKMATVALSGATLLFSAFYALSFLIGDNGASVTSTPTPITSNKVNLNEPFPLITYSPPSANSDTKINIEKAEKAYYSGNYEASLKYSLMAAADGNARAMNAAGLNYEKLKKPELAIEWYQKAVQSGYGDAFANLGRLLIERKQINEGVSVLEAGVAQNHTASINELAFYSESVGNKQRAKQLYLKASNLGHAMSMYNYALMQEEEGNIAEAKKWYLKSMEAGYSDSINALGYLYEQEADWINAKKYYELAAKAGDPYGLYNLAIVLGNRFSDKSTRPCELLNQALATKNLDASLREDIREAIVKGCSNKVSQTSPLASNSTQGPTLASDDFKESAPISKNVQISDIFGRVFEDSTGNWVITLSNYKEQPVPPITGIQFRLIGFPNADWLHIPYKLKTSSVTESVYASVDGIMLAILLQRPDVCPEFRAVREEKDEIVRIWSKGQPECANDYKP